MTVKKPNSLIYFLVFIFLYPILKIFLRLKVDKSDYTAPKGPFIAVSSHSSFVDFLIVMLALYPKKMNAVTAAKFFLYKPLNRFLPLMGCIPKNLFEPDIRSIIGIKTVLKRGDNILLFPEGRCTDDGVYAGMHKATGKLIKKLNVPVVTCNIDGAYVCMPFWRKGIKSGRIRIIVRNLFSLDDLNSLSVESITEKLDASLSGENDPPPYNPFMTFSKKGLAEGLENIIYWCPKCNSEFMLRSFKCTIQCSNCGYGANIDRYQKLTPLADNSIVYETIHEWFRDQAIYEGNKLSHDMKPIGEHVTVGLPSTKSGGGIVKCGDGFISLSPDGWRFNGNIKNEDVSLYFPIETVPAVPIDPNDIFQIYANGTLYAFTPDAPRRCIQYSVLGEAAYWKFSAKPSMTARLDSGFRV